ncbi:MAG: DUF86 domain-containing protein [Candidatus Korarchaeota archaeon]|nr:DUF86 domain-containing protein [Candidatus Korarchaeota archaeon]
MRSNSLARFMSHYRRARDLKERDLSDYLIYTALAMECFQATNSLIEIGERFVVDLDRYPATYSDIFQIMYEEGAITREELRALKRLIFLRNPIAHEYYGISEEELREMADLLDVAERIVRRLMKHSHPS